MVFLGHFVLLEEAAGIKPLGLMVASIDTNPECDLDICQILVSISMTYLVCTLSSNFSW